jgi:hypothetical protein
MFLPKDVAFLFWVQFVDLTTGLITVEIMGPLTPLSLLTVNQIRHKPSSGTGFFFFEPPNSSELRTPEQELETSERSSWSSSKRKTRAPGARVDLPDEGLFFIDKMEPKIVPGLARYHRGPE